MCLLFYCGVTGDYRQISLIFIACNMKFEDIVSHFHLTSCKPTLNTK